MSKGRSLRALVAERLTAAAEEVFALVERTMAEYEEELSRSKEENQRKQRLLERLLSPPQAHGLSSDVQIQTERRSEVSIFKQEEEKHPDVACVIVKSEGDYTDIDCCEFPASPPHVETEAGTEACSPGPETTGPQTTDAVSAADVLNSEGADKVKKCPVGKRKRGKPRRMMAPLTDASETPPQQRPTPDDETREETLGDRGEAEPDRNYSELMSSALQTEPGTKRDAVRNKDLETSPAPSKCPKSKRNCGRAPLQRPVCSITFTTEKEEGADFKCSLCERVFTRLHHLERHVLTHTGERSFCCSVCNKSFKLKHHLISHLAIHTEERLYGCPICTKKFKRKDNLGRHIMVHSGLRPFGCSQCDVQFALKKNLTRHMIIHNRDITYSCSVCKMKFTSPFYFKKHTKTHMNRK